MSLCLSPRYHDSLYRNKPFLLLLLLLSKTFATLNFDKPLSKLRYYGLSKIPPKLITNYLTNRNQYVKFESCISNLVLFSTGIPLSSILGPLLFSIYIKDLVMASSKLNYMMYADDTTLYFNLE